MGACLGDGRTDGHEIAEGGRERGREDRQLWHRSLFSLLTTHVKGESRIFRKAKLDGRVQGKGC